MKIVNLVLAVGIFGSIVFPTVTHAEWVHEESGISLPDEIGVLKRSETKDLSNGRQTDVMLQYGSSTLAATVYVYKASYPNVALWFGRTLIAMKENVGGFDQTQTPVPFKIGGALNSNGLREGFEIEHPGGRAGNFKSTAVAMAQFNEWIIKLRISSPDLPRADTEKLMDQLIGALHFSKPVSQLMPLTAPERCKDNELSWKGKPAEGKEMETLVPIGVVNAVAEYASAFGEGNLAKHPEQWCEFTMNDVPPYIAAAYRPKQQSGYVIVLGDSGRTIATQSLLTPEKTADTALYTNVQGSTHLVWMFDGVPPPTEALGAALPILLGRQPGLGQVSFGRSAPKEPSGTVK